MPGCWEVACLIPLPYCPGLPVGCGSWQVARGQRYCWPGQVMGTAGTPNRTGSTAHRSFKEREQACSQFSEFCNLQVMFLLPAAKFWAWSACLAKCKNGKIIGVRSRFYPFPNPEENANANQNTSSFPCSQRH